MIPVSAFMLWPHQLTFQALQEMWHVKKTLGILTCCINQYHYYYHSHYYLGWKDKKWVMWFLYLILRCSWRRREYSPFLPGGFPLSPAVSPLGFMCQVSSVWCRSKCYWYTGHFTSGYRSFKWPATLYQTIVSTCTVKSFPLFRF